MRALAIIASALVPGLGQLARGRVIDALLFGFAMVWVRSFLAGHAALDDRLVAFVFGVPAIDNGLRTPVLVVFTGLLVGLHALSAWDAGRQGKGSGEVDSNLAP